MQKIESRLMPEYDVLVVGGGVAGVAAAVAAARHGAKTLLMEKSVILGGLATAGLISWYEPLCDGEGKQLIGGISEELIRLAGKYGFDNLPPKWGGTGRNPIHYDRFACRFSPTVFALALIEYLQDNHVDIRFDTLATYPEMSDGVCTGVTVETVGGREFFPAKTVVDATGDACICYRAGMPTELGKNFMSYVTHEMNDAEAKALAETGDFCTARHWRSAASDMNGNGQPEGMPPLAVKTADDVTQYMIYGGRMVLNRLKKTDKESRDIMMLPTMPQFRTIRRIIGEYTFTGEEDGQRFENAVGAFGDFRRAGRHFQLPYTALYNNSFKNLLAAGRIISAVGEGWEITRVIPVAALTGQISGTAAALCCKAGLAVNELPARELRRTLLSDGAMPAEMQL